MSQQYATRTLSRAWSNALTITAGSHSPLRKTIVVKCEVWDVWNASGQINFYITAWIVPPMLYDFQTQNDSGAFQETLFIILAAMKKKLTSLILDDVLIYSNSHEENIGPVRTDVTLIKFLLLLEVKKSQIPQWEEWKACSCNKPAVLWEYIGSSRRWLRTKTTDRHN